MVRQYKIHTNLDGADDKVLDVTNGKVRLYQPSNLGLQSTNNIWQSNGVGVMGTRSITQPQIEFKLETFGESLEENYRLMKDFINDILNQKFITLEYQTEIFQVYADLALADVTKTEGYGKNGTFSEKITFDIITKWYTYENLTFDMIQNGQVIAGKSKIYGGYKGSETALQNYNRLKASPSLNLPNLNLLSGTSTKVVQATHWNMQVADIKYDKSLGGDLCASVMINNADHASVLSRGLARINIQTFDQSGKILASVDGNEIAYDSDGLSQCHISIDDNIASVKVVIFTNNMLENAFYSRLKLEQGTTATPWLPSASEITTGDISEYFGYNYIANQAYTYYGESNIDRLSRWDIKDEIFSFMGILYPKLPKTPTGIRFLDDIGNEYTAIVFKTGQLQNYILINTDVNDEIYQGWNGTTPLNLFPVMDFERYRTRIIEKGQMELINLSKAEFKIKRKADFV
ncbi:distal tail protein [Lactococcus phage 88605]|uniref:Distal tail protein n=1 Tax=Lactococcus phage 88605 TaxID=2029673 RepID=A0A343JQN5_9CAUD|nr:tail protein [Lactococcus phage 88605]ASZ71808.1 distal tail protein [Lactococcus phage 88605]